ncbi:MAG: chaperone modulator CbpM [Peptococcaceae bacterium]|nr:chaperone modulator CbpM [Peptococcaceae bacterium]
MKRFYLQVYHHTLSKNDEDPWVDASSLGIHPEIINLLSEMGIVETHMGCVPAQQAARIQKLIRLRRDLGVNLQGAAIILNLLERMERLEDEIERLKRR